MARSSVVHSNATNFQSFVQNNVDQRTGQYTLAIDLKLPNGNHLIGPGLPLRLSFSPFNNKDSGFGKGWDLALTQYIPGTGMLTLHTGESYKVTGSGAQPPIREKKLDSFHFHDDSQGCKQQYRVVHKSGLEEILSVYGDENPVALPSEVRAPSGHSIQFDYAPDTQRLMNIIDGNGAKLLELKYTEGRVTVDTHPGANGNGLPFLRHRLELKNRSLVEVVLPAELGGNWRFEYTTARGLNCLAKVSTPLGAIEEIRYGENQDPGHVLPGSQPLRSLPRVTSHVVKPRADQPAMTTTFTYKRLDQDAGIEVENSFVGSNSNISWRDDGEDNLYRAQANYRYSVTAHYWKAGKVVRKQTQTFNRHHLMTLQTLEQDGHIEETETLFHEQPGVEFANQPAFFQLPRQITKRWKLHSDASKLHEETATTFYDTYGNVVEELQPSGVRVTYEYYGKDGETADSWSCPADPQGFVRNLKCKTVYPVPGQPGNAPVQRTRLSYKAYPVLTSLDKSSQWLAPTEEHVVQVIDAGLPSETEQLLVHVERGYLNMPGNALLHGRPDYQGITRYSEDPARQAFDNRTARTQWRYEARQDPLYGQEYWTHETATGFDNVQKTSRLAASALHGQTVYEEDDFGNSIRRRYDALARLVEEVVAPGNQEDEATISYGYTLVTHPETGSAGLAAQWVTGSTGVTTFHTFDGCNRVIKEERETAGLVGAEHARVRKRVAESNYDELGQLSDRTTFDYYEDRTLSLKSTFEYDAWGQLCKTTLPTGVTTHSERSPFGKDGDITTTWMQTPDRPGKRQLQQIVESNRFDKISYQYRLDDADTVVGRHDYSYDGLGRCTHEEHNFNRAGKAPVRRVTGYAYDAEGRVTRTERPDQSAVLSEFALHSPAALAEKLLVQPNKSADPILAWHREYDSHERLTSMAAGLQQESYTYKDNTSLVETRTTKAKRTFTYHYRPTRSAQPARIEVSNLKTETKFDYDRHTAAIDSAESEQGKRSYTYTDQGYLRETNWEDVEGDRYGCTYQTSLQGLPLGYSDSDGVAVTHEYNDLGQLAKTTQGNLVATFEYDTAGRLWKTQTSDRANKQVLLCEQTYDSLSREDTRTQTLTKCDGTELTQVIQLTWHEDDQLHTRTLSRDGQPLLLETFNYDALDRLEEHTCTGSALPCNTDGKPITMQYFIYDALNNLSECYTDFKDGNMEETVYTHEGFILKQARRNLLVNFSIDQAFKRDDNGMRVKTAGMPKPSASTNHAFEHDADGNLLNDEQGNRLFYDEHGRLIEVQRTDDKRPLYRYRYDGHNDLVGIRHGQATEMLRRYQGYRVSSTREDDLLTQYLYAGDRPLGLQRPAQAADNRLFMTDAANSVVGECSGDELRDTQYTAYGETPDNDALVGLLGFNGEARERALGWSLLGRGYRAYNPRLMRFHTPDAAAPEDAGINPYVYCGGNPVNWHDPSGHYGMRHSMENPFIPPTPQPKPKADWRSWLGVALGAVFAVISIIMLPPVGLTMAFAIGASSLALDVAATAVSVVALATMNDGLNNAAFWLGIASALSTLGVMGYSRFAARGAVKGVSVGTQAATDTASIEVGTRRGSTVARGLKRRASAPSRMTSEIPKYDSALEIKRTNTLNLDWGSLPPGKKGILKNNPLYADDSINLQTSESGTIASATSPSPVAAVQPASPTKKVPLLESKQWPKVITTPAGNYIRHLWETPPQKAWKV